MILVRARTASRSRLLRPFNGLSLCFQTSPDGSYKFPWRGNLRWGWRESLAPALDSPGTGSRGLREFLRGNVIHQYKTFFYREARTNLPDWRSWSVSKICRTRIC